MNILVVDPSYASSGWASLSDGKRFSGVYGYKKKSKEDNSVRLIYFEEFFQKLITDLQINFLAYEMPSFVYKASFRAHSQLEGILLLLCAKNNLKYIGIAPTEIKKQAGKGNYNKDEMFVLADEKFGDVLDHNHADALWLLDLIEKVYDK
jgi:Holliday junction resolvasome RuvABC endonuclease subunit